MLSHPLPSVAAVARRRHLLRPLALECFLVPPPPGGPPGWDVPSVLFAFQSPAEREAALAALRAQPTLGAAATGVAGSVAAAGQLLEAEGGWLRKVSTSAGAPPPSTACPRLTPPSTLTKGHPSLAVRGPVQLRLPAVPQPRRRPVVQRPGAVAGVPVGHR